MRIARSSISFFIFTVLIILLGIHLKFSLQEWRLPTNLSPIDYHLIIYANLDGENPVFSGQVQIRMKCNEDTNEIILNTKNLTISEENVSVFSADSVQQVYYIVGHGYSPQTDQYKITLDANLAKGAEYMVYIPFAAQFSDDSRGFILLTSARLFETEAGTKTYYAVTHLGESDARRVLPCFDQIDLKAKFLIQIAHPVGFKSFSNMNLSTSESFPAFGEWVMDTFIPTSMLIPPCLITIALVPREYKSEKLSLTGSNPRIQVYAHEFDLQRIQYGEALLLRAFDFYKRDFSVPYTLPKLKVIVFPDFQHGTEVGYYGTIAMGRSTMMIEESSASTFSKFSTIMEICRLTSHLWIGVYVTMSSWNEYWLHDALKLDSALACVDSISEWEKELVSVYIGDEFFSVLKHDQAGLIDKSPDSMDDDDEPQSWKMDYRHKGHRLIQMLNFIFGEVFQVCITIYLRKFALETSTVRDVWTTFSECAIFHLHFLPGKLLVETIMDSWTKQTGYPLVTVTANYETNTLMIEQTKFKLLDQLNEDEEGSSHGPECWIIPVNYFTKSELRTTENVRVRVWLTCDNASVERNVHFDDKWILVNSTLSVPSRTNYNLENWILLRNALLNSEEYLEIGTMTRAKLISDMFELPRAGVLSYEIFFGTIYYLAHERSHLPWKIISEELETIRIQLFQSNILDRYMKYIRQILKPVFDSFEGQLITEPFMRNSTKSNVEKIIFELSCNFGVDACLSRCDLFFNYFSQNTQNEGQNMGTFPEHVRHIIYCHAIKNNGQNEWNFLRSLYNRKNPGTNNDIILEALGCSPDTDTLKKYLMWSLKRNKAEPSDNFKIFKSLAKNENGYELMKNFFKQKLEKIYEINSEESLPIDPYFATLFDNTMTERDMNELKALALYHQDKFKDYDKVFNHNIKVARRNVIWLQKNEADLSKIFSQT